MIGYDFSGDISSFKQDGKTGWAEGRLAHPTYFCHGANKTTPGMAETYGINPMHAQDADRQLGREANRPAVWPRRKRWA